MDRFFEAGYVDAWRYLHPDAKGGYTWWSQRFPSVRAENKGWRIDYISVTEPLKDRLKGSAILPDAVHSDHCPVMIELG
jgi:exodeoxyribonuclease-3